MSTISAAQLAGLLGDWRAGDRARHGLAVRLRALVLDARIPLETRLPAQRSLASALGVSRTTVSAAYDQLARDGYLRTRRGAGSFAAVPGGLRGVPDALAPADGVDLRVAAFPAPALLEDLAARAAGDLARWLDNHGYDPLGLPPLRRAIADRFSARGLATRPEQILVTSGALHALDLTLRALVPRGRPVIAELPTYPAALDALRAAGCRLRTVPVTTKGWDLDVFEATVRQTSPVLAYLIPDFQNPTGAPMETALRRTMLARLGRAGAVTVVDETFVGLDLGSEPREPQAPAAACASGVVTLGSLSKSAWGGLRVGWVRAEPSVIARIATVRSTSDMASPVLDQLLGVRVLEHLDEILTERRALLLERYRRLAGALADQLGSWRWTPPTGGLALWAELPAPFSTTLALRARDHGVHLAPGPRFGAAGLLERYLRLPFTQPPDRLEHAVSTLAALVRHDSGRDRPPPPPERPPQYVA